MLRCPGAVAKIAPGICIYSSKERHRGRRVDNTFNRSANPSTTLSTDVPFACGRLRMSAFACVRVFLGKAAHVAKRRYRHETLTTLLQKTNLRSARVNGVLRSRFTSRTASYESNWSLPLIRT